MKNTKSIILSGVAALLLSSNVNAEEITTEVKLSATSNYVSRGMTQSNDNPAIFGEATAFYGNFFGGIWASNVEFEGADADSEIDLYIGYVKTFGDLETVLSYTRFLYPNSDDLNDMDEATIDLSYPINNFTVGAKYAVGTYVENDGDKLNYIEAFTSYSFEKDYSVKLSAGSLDDIGDNITLSLAKEYSLSDGTINVDLSYSDFKADTISEMEDEKNLFATVEYTF